MKTKILVIGSSGFIGTNLILHLLAQKYYNIMGIDKDKPKIVDDNLLFEQINIEDCNKLEDSILNFSPDYIIHLAARTDLNGLSLDDYSANTIGVKNIMNIVNNIPNLKKVVLASSMLVCHAGYYPKNQFDYAPTTKYGESKVETEKIIWENQPNCDWAIIRPTSIWGPWFGVPYKNFFDMIINHKYFHIGNIGCTKTYGYVGNAIYQIEKILFTPTLDLNKKVYYIGDNPATNIEEWGNEIADQLGYRLLKMPFWIIKLAAIFGDFLKKIGISFPMTSFRLHNMTTDNIIDLTLTNIIAPNPPFTRVDGVKKTLDWIFSKLN